MTFEEATTLKNTMNEALQITGAQNIVTYGVFAYWERVAEKVYNIVLFPKTYEDKFETATDSQKIAFYRVYLKTIGIPVSYEEFVTAYNAQKALDNELNNYLKL
jgi:hypothetical protein